MTDDYISSDEWEEMFDDLGWNDETEGEDDIADSLAIRLYVEDGEWVAVCEGFDKPLSDFGRTPSIALRRLADVIELWTAVDDCNNDRFVRPEEDFEFGDERDVLLEAQETHRDVDLSEFLGVPSLDDLFETLTAEEVQALLDMEGEDDD